MGILTDTNGRLSVDLIDKIDEDFGRRVRKGEILSQDEIDALAKRASDFLSHDIRQYESLVGDLARLAEGDSYGLPQGHEGLNELFMSICAMAIAEDRLRTEIIDGLKSMGT